MATLRNKQKIAALEREKCQEHSWINSAQNSNVPRSQENYVTQVSDEIESRVTKKLSLEFCRMESCILVALSRLDDFLLNPLIQGYSGTALEMTLNTLRTNQGTKEGNSQSDPHPEVSVYQSQTTRNSSPDEAYHRLSSIKFCLVTLLHYRGNM